MPESLRERLIGAWDLVDVIEEPVDGSVPRRAHGRQPAGLFLYTPDGYMSAQIMQGDRPDVTSGDWSDLTPEEYAEEARTHFAYSGPFHVDEDRGLVGHSMVVSLIPGWVGQTQPRSVEIDGDCLRLSAVEPALSGGVIVTTRLRWRRAAAAGAAE